MVKCKRVPYYAPQAVIRFANRFNGIIEPVFLVHRSRVAEALGACARVLTPEHGGASLGVGGLFYPVSGKN